MVRAWVVDEAKQLPHVVGEWRAGVMEGDELICPGSSCVSPKISRYCSVRVGGAVWSSRTVVKEFPVVRERRGVPSRACTGTSPGPARADVGKMSLTCT